MNKSIDLGVVSDEISVDLDVALNHASTWGISLLEIRCLKSGRIPDVEPSELKRLHSIVKNKDAVITALSPGIFKHPLSLKAELENEILNTLPRTIDIAQELCCPLIIVFGFKRESGESPENRKRAIDLLRRASEISSKNDVKLAIENEPGFWCDSGANTAQIIQDVNSPGIGANWDPCNGYGTEENPYPDGYENIKHTIINVHVKDTKKGSLIECVPVGEGAIDWKGQMRALVNDQIVSHVTVETHCLPLIEQTHKNIQTLWTYLKDISQEEEIRS